MLRCPHGNRGKRREQEHHQDKGDFSDQATHNASVCKRLHQQLGVLSRKTMVTQ
jgi:hypothetical protein